MPRAGLSPDVLSRAAADLADEVGLERVTMTALARRFDVAVPSLYSHVRSNADLKVQVALLALAELGELVGAEMAGRTGPAAIEALGRVYREYAAAHPGRSAATSVPIDAETARTSSGPRIAETVRTVLERSYGLEDPALTHATRLLGSTVRGWTELEAAGAFGHRAPDAAASWERAVEGLDAVFRGWAAS
jgi:AcrR family transcriptional regulator